MSGDQLRNFAILGNEQQLRALLQGGANPCSVDQEGLTALHYAVWNNHVDCMKVLVANCDGTDESGTHCSSLSMKSDIGLTALHLSVMEGSDAFMCRYLTMAGCDISIKDNLDRTSYMIAKETGNKEAADFLKQTKKLKVTSEQIAAFNEGNLKDFHEQTTRKNMADYPSHPKDENGDPMPLTREDKIPVPFGLDMPEHHIYPYAKLNSEKGRAEGAEAIRALTEVVEQSKNNERRREILANATEYDLRRRGLMN